MAGLCLFLFSEKIDVDATSKDVVCRISRSPRNKQSYLSPDCRTRAHAEKNMHNTVGGPPSRGAGRRCP